MSHDVTWGMGLACQYWMLLVPVCTSRRYASTSSSRLRSEVADGWMNPSTSSGDAVNTKRERSRRLREGVFWGSWAAGWGVVREVRVRAWWYGRTYQG